VGPDARASILTLCDYVQEAAGEHARAGGVEDFALPGGAGTWVLSRLRLRVAERPAMRETVSVVTWPSGYDGLRAERDFVVVRGAVDAADPDAALAGATCLMRGTSTWFVMSVARRRPVRLPAALGDFQPPDRPRALPPADADPAAPDDVRAEARFTVRRSDLDRVGHANNVRFAEWALEAAARLDPPPGRLAGLDLTFRAEAVEGDTVVSTVGPAANHSALAHRLARESDGRDLAFARTLWTLDPT
jgi:acyl-ACP thioesterase